MPRGRRASISPAARALPARFRATRPARAAGAHAALHRDHCDRAARRPASSRLGWRQARRATFERRLHRLQLERAPRLLQRRRRRQSELGLELQEEVVGRVAVDSGAARAASCHLAAVRDQARALRQRALPRRRQRRQCAPALGERRGLVAGSAPSRPRRARAWRCSASTSRRRCASPRPRRGAAPPRRAPHGTPASSDAAAIAWRRPDALPGRVGAGDLAAQVGARASAARRLESLDHGAALGRVRLQGGIARVEHRVAGPEDGVDRGAEVGPGGVLDRAWQRHRTRLLLPARLQLADPACRRRARRARTPPRRPAPARRSTSCSRPRRAASRAAPSGPSSRSSDRCMRATSDSRSARGTVCSSGPSVRQAARKRSSACTTLRQSLAAGAEGPVRSVGASPPADAGATTLGDRAGAVG